MPAFEKVKSWQSELNGAEVFLTQWKRALTSFSKAAKDN